MRIKPGSAMMELTWRLRNAKKAIKQWAMGAARTDEELEKALKELEVGKRELFQTHTDGIK